MQRILQKIIKKKKIKKIIIEISKEKKNKILLKQQIVTKNLQKK